MIRSDAHTSTAVRPRVARGGRCQGTPPSDHSAARAILVLLAAASLGLSGCAEGATVIPLTTDAGAGSDQAGGTGQAEDGGGTDTSNRNLPREEGDGGSTDPADAGRAQEPDTWATSEPDGLTQDTPGVAPNDVTTADCGDGVIAAPETCDDGSNNGTYGFCKADCSGDGPTCGDGVLDLPFEQCDDGPKNGPEAPCSDTCQPAPSPWISTSPLMTPSTDGLVCNDDSDLLAKYFRYRRRLRGDMSAAYPGFVVIGEGPGRSMPAGHRAPTLQCSGYWGFGSCPPEDVPNALGLYKWGDATIWLGDYMAMLGLEYALFANLGLPTEQTLDDLRLALAALDRLDLSADTYFAGAVPALDGFFLRDDVPADIMQLDGGGYRFPRDDGYAGYGCAAGDLLGSCGVPSVEDGSFTSQDQSIGLVFGLGVVAAMVPDGIVVKGVAVRQDARAKVHRLVMAFRDHNWRVTAPDGTHPPDAWGGNAIGFSNQLAKAANAICGTDFGVTDYRDALSKTAGQAAWNGIQVIWETTHGYNRTMALRLASLTDDWDAKKLAKKALSDGKDYFVLIYALVHGLPLEPPFSDWRMESLLRSAPCGGPCWGTAACSNTAGWRGESRSVSPQDRMGSQHQPTAAFNGLDYLAIFSAWHLYKSGAWQVSIGEPPATACEAFVPLDQVLASGASSPATWDPTDPCARDDLQRVFCGRPFGAWVNDAVLGHATIYAGGARWSCAPGGPCTLTTQLEQHTSGDDLILGTPGNDNLSGGDGNDCLVGFDGDDELRGNQGYDWLDGGPGDDALYGENSGVVLDGEGDVLKGGLGNDHLRGGPGKDELHGGQGSDDLDGGAGDDFLLGGPGDDTLDGYGGDDFLDGGDGDDALVGDAGSDQLYGGPGHDKLDGEGGDDYLNGGLGSDFLRGGAGDDTLISGDSWGPPPMLDSDRLCGNGGDDTLWGGWDGDECLGGGWFLGGTDTVSGCDDKSASEGDCDNGAYKAW